MGQSDWLSAPRLAADTAGHARLLADVRQAVLSGSPAPAVPRPLVVESWDRCRSAGVDPDRQQPVHGLDPGSVADVRGGHPLAPALPLLRTTLVSVADELLHVMVVADAAGHVLWLDGANTVRRLAERIDFVEGALWTEGSVGTNAIGTALAIDRPVQIYAAEHFVSDQHVWTCAAAPIRDPETDSVLGVVDVSGPFQTIHPSTAALVQAAARLAEEHLRLRMAVRDERFRQEHRGHMARLRGGPGALVTRSGRVVACQPAGWLKARLDLSGGRELYCLPDGGTATVEPVGDGFLVRPVAGQRGSTGSRRRLALAVLGTRDPSVTVGGRERRVTLRHAELLTVLALHPAGRTAEQLALQLYGERGNPVTVRAEMHRLRASLGDLIGTKPYRLVADVDADVLAVRRLVGQGRLGEAVRRYAGPLLPLSEAPAVREERDELAAVVRRAVLDHDDAETLLRWTQRDGGDGDVEALTRLLALLDRADPRRVEIAVRRERLQAGAAATHPAGRVPAARAGGAASRSGQRMTMPPSMTTDCPVM